MLEVDETDEFLEWIDSLRSAQVRSRIRTRLRRLSWGNPGPHRVLAGGIVELKIDHDAGYRVYYTRIGPARRLVLRGGDKQSQQRDIEAARRAARE